jgi:hypothetical protein
MLKLLVLFALVASALAGPIKVIGLTDDSTVIIQEISSADYRRSLSTMLSEVEQQLIIPLAPKDSSGNWHLKRIVVGLGMTGEIGIGPYKIGTALKQRFVYGR